MEQAESRNVRNRHVDGKTTGSLERPSSGVLAFLCVLGCGLIKTGIGNPAPPGCHSVSSELKEDILMVDIPEAGFFFPSLISGHNSNP